MTCQECQPLAIDLARGVPPLGIGGAVQRGDVLSHIARCKRCAQWLAEQEALTEALRVAAEADTLLSAPMRVEANVMAAFRARQAQQPAPGGRASKPSWLAWPGSGLAAAAAVVIFGLSLMSLRVLMTAPSAAGAVPNHEANASAVAAGGRAGNGGGAEAGAAAGADAGAHTGNRAGNGAGSAAGESHAPVAGTNAAVVEVLPEKGSKGRGRPTPAPPRVVAPQAMASQAFAARSVSVGRSSSSIGGATSIRGASSPRGAGATRGASEFGGPAFVLLPYAEPLRPTEMRHIMRVRMSRTLVVAGDVQGDSADGTTVLADVLVGEDGMARAVRIVQ